MWFLPEAHHIHTTGHHIPQHGAERGVRFKVGVKLACRRRAKEEEERGEGEEKEGKEKRSRCSVC